MSARAGFDVLTADLGPGLLLLEASAGTGKTWSLTSLAARAFVQGRLDDIGQLLLVTFTNAATDDLRTRLRARLQETLRAALHPQTAGDDVFLVEMAACADAAAIERLRRALRDFDRARVHTIHSYCARLLQETAFEAGTQLELGEPADARQLREAALADAWRSLVVEGEPWLVACAASSGWKPADHLSLVEARARHRRLEIRPRGESLATVGARIEDALHRVDERCDPLVVAGFLSPLLEAPSGAFTKSGLAEHGAGIAHALHLLQTHGDEVTARHQAWIELAHHLEGAAGARSTEKTLRGLTWFEELTHLHAALVPVEDALRTAVLARTQEHLRRNKQHEEQLDFDDLVQRVRETLDDPERRATLVALVRSTTRMACIDEFQDTDVDQWEIFRTLFGESVTLVLVGDPKQAIYGFRGADVYAYLDARAEVRAGGGREAGLAQNFRSHPDLVQAVNRIFGRGTAAFAAEGIEHADVQARRDAHERSLEGDPGPAFRLLPVTTTRKQKSAHERAVIAATVAEIRRLLGAGLRLRTERGERPLSAGDITVLTRTHHQSMRVHRALREARIASVLGRSGDVHQSEAMEELGLILEAIFDPRDPRTVRRALVTRLWGVTLSELAMSDSTDGALADAHALLEELRQLWHRHGVLVAADRLLYRRRVAVRLLAEAEGDRLLTDLRHALELVHRAAVDGQLSPGGTLHWLWRERTRRHDRDETRQLRLDRDDDAVRILTAHGAKGLEYEIVLVPFAWDGSTPRAPLQWHERAEGERRLVIDTNKHAPGSPESARAQRELLAEELRLLYVALTRAKRRCVVLLTPYYKDASRNAGRSALFYLLHRAAVRAGEMHDDYVRRCIDELAAGPSKWEPLVPSWIADHVCIGVQGSASGDTIAPGAADTVLEARTRVLPRDLGTRLQPWSLVSFSSLTRSAHAAREAAVVEADPSEAPIAERADPATASTLLRPSAPEGIFAFARGARAGVCLHEIFETGDFSHAPQDGDRGRIVRILERHGLDDPRVHDGSLDPCNVAEELLLQAAKETFPFGGFPLSAVDRAHRLDEWEFRAALGRVRIGELADLFAQHAEQPWSRLLPPRLRRLDDRAVEGLLGGFVDLLFEHAGRWYVVDWKSNHLGDRPDDYDPAALETAMLEHDYVLQLTLYTLAVHRFLGRRLRGYRYDEHFGGAAYAFFRGWCGRPDRGWFAWRPPRALIEAIDAAFGPGGSR